LTTVLVSTAYSFTQIKKWLARFKAGDFSCDDKFRHHHPPHVLGKTLSDLRKEFPFATAGIIVQHFSQPRPTIKEIIQWELGLQRFARR
jgi:hypothetical protein